MKKFSFLQNSFYVLLALSLFTFTACEEDGGTGPGGTGGIPPSISFANNGLGSITADATVAAGEVFVLNVTASEGDSPMKTLTISEDGTELADERIVAGWVGGANPALLVGANATSINWDIPINVHADGIRTYRVTIEDEAGETSSEAVDITVASTPPSLTLNGNTAISADAGNLVSINVTATKGSVQITKIGVQEDGNDVDVSRLEYNDVAFTNNPEDLPEADKDGFDMSKVSIRTVDNAGETHTYTIYIQDDAGNQELVTVDITTNPTGTAITGNLDGVLFSKASPVSGTGGLNLWDGASTATASTDAHIKDLGVDTNLDPADNWIQRITGANGSAIRMPDMSVLPEGFSFANISFKEEIAGAFDSGINLTDMIDGELVTNKLQQGDVLLVKNGSDTFIIEIAEVDVRLGYLPNGNVDNGDNYKVNIKY